MSLTNRLWTVVDLGQFKFYSPLYQSFFNQSPSTSAPNHFCQNSQHTRKLCISLSQFLSCPPSTERSLNFFSVIVNSVIWLQPPQVFFPFILSSPFTDRTADPPFFHHTLLSVLAVPVRPPSCSLPNPSCI